MAFYDHTYASYPFNLSSYANNLDTVAKHAYINKLIINLEDGGVFFIPDPYTVQKNDWKYTIESLPSIEMSDIEEYLNSTPGQNHRSRSAYDYVTSGKVQDVKVHVPSSHPEYAVIAGSVQPSQRCNADLHQPWILVKEDGDIKTAHCTCVAGFGEVCSHVFAVLYKVQLAVSAKLTGAPTEKLCKWNHSIPKKVPCAPLKEIVFDKINWATGENKRRKIYIHSPAKVEPMTSAQIAELKSFYPEAVVFSLLGGDSSDTDTSGADNDEDLPPTILEVISKTEVKGIESLLPFFSERTSNNLEIRTRLQSNSSLWFEHRRGRLTASKFGKILRRKKITPEFLDVFWNVDKQIHTVEIKWGRDNEENGFNCYENSEKDKHGNFSLRKAGLFISPTDPYLGCSPDGYISCECCGSGVLEIKCPYKYRNVDPRNIAAMDTNFYLDTEGNLKEDHLYFAQVQGQMVITNTNYCDFVVWTRKDILTTRVRRDHDFWNDNKAALKSFFFKNLLPYLQSK